MNCAQVMELMQRHLDGDLNNEELELMANHLENCPECAEMMQRLKQIDQDLANLPKVTPPFSIVDSILPKLKEMDEISATDGGTAGNVRHIASRSEAAAIDGGAQRTRWYRTNLARFGSFAAAAAVLGILIVQGLPDRINDNGNFERQESTASGGTSTMASSAETLPTFDSAVANSAEPRSAPAERQSDLSPPKAKSNDEPVSSKAPETRSRLESIEPTGKVDIMGFGLASDSSSASPGGGESVESAPTASREEVREGEGYGIAGGTLYAEVSVPNEPADAAGFVSGDGAFSAFVETMEDGTLAVVVKEVNGNVSFTSENRWHPDFASVELMVWNGSKLSYSVKTGESVRTFVIDASNGTETEISE